jgi:molecular chaperone HscB
LTERYQELQKVVHPDRFASAGDRERRIAVQLAAHVNEAYHALMNPLSRAVYLLGLSGINVESVSVQDAQFLMQQMTLRETLEGIQASVAHDKDELLQKFLDNLCRDEDLLKTDLEALFSQGTDESLQQAATIVHKMQFFRRLKISVSNES